MPFIVSLSVGKIALSIDAISRMILHFPVDDTLKNVPRLMIIFQLIHRLTTAMMLLFSFSKLSRVIVNDACL